MLLVTGGAGFIGSNFVVATPAQADEPIVTLDKLSYAGSLMNLAAVSGDARHVFVRGDICDRELVRGLLRKHQPRAIVHFAAESHVDRSISGPAEFVQANVVGTWSLLEEARAYRKDEDFRFLHISTDEVYGTLGPDDPAFIDKTRARKGGSYADLISFVTDRPGHDRRYAMNISKIRRELGWQPKESFETGLEKTVQWYLANLDRHFAKAVA